jgi:ketosteroid isomerase-like protein
MDIPEVIRSYFDAAERRDTDGVVATMAPEVVVVDDGKTWEGRDGVRAWKSEVTSAFDYTTELTGSRETGPTSYVVTGHVVGNFPGGEVDLDYAFALVDGLIARLEIGV